MGIVAVEMMDAEPPFWGMERREVYQHIIDPKIPMGAKHPDDWSDSLTQFVSLCLTKDPAKRPPVDKLLEHPFLQLCLSPRPPGEPGLGPEPVATANSAEDLLGMSKK